MKRTTRRMRTADEFARIYGSRERLAWVKAHPCVFCGRIPCDNAHVTNGGTGRKADAEFIVPACSDYFDRTLERMVTGCHHEMDHGAGKAAMERHHDLDLLEAAAEIDAEWRLTDSSLEAEGQLNLLGNP